MSPPPTTFIFDLDGVLCDYDLDARLKYLSQVCGLVPAEIRAALWDSGFENAADAGAWPDGATFLAEFARRLDHPLTRGQWIEARRVSMTPWPQMLALVDRLGRSGRTALLTNNVPLLAETLDEVFPPVSRLFGDRVFFSCHLRLAKPDPAIYREVCRRLRCQPGATIFVDDKPENAEGARQAKLAGIHFTGPEALVDALARHGVAL